MLEEYQTRWSISSTFRADFTFLSFSAWITSGESVDGAKTFHLLKESLSKTTKGPSNFGSNLFDLKGKRLITASPNWSFNVRVLLCRLAIISLREAFKCFRTRVWIL